MININILLSNNENCEKADKSKAAAIREEAERAFENGEFKVYLQPKVNMVSNKLYGAEALSRWEHPVDGIRSPGLYIPLLEENGLITRLDMYMYEEICRLKSEWKDKSYGHIPISVNMSRKHIYIEDFVDRLAQIAEKYGVNRGEIDIEVTESVFMQDGGKLIEVINKLKSYGFLVSIDDFGSGFSALNMLKDINADIIKIDKEFLEMSSDNVKGKKVIKHVISMCRDLKFDVVTEGIETREQADFISSCGCLIAQGYFYSKPLALDKFQEFADQYMVETIESYTFRLNGDLKSEDGSFEGIISGEGLYYTQGIYSDTKALHFPGGATEKNTIHIPPETIANDSFTISMWIKPEELFLWTAAIYIKFETGFCSIVPFALDEKSDVRIRYSIEVNGWYDIYAEPLKKNEWSHYTVSYNAKTEVLTSFINGEKIQDLENVPTNRFVKWIILGGDVFQPSFVGDICEVRIYNEAKDCEYVRKLYDRYVSNARFLHKEDMP